MAKEIKCFKCKSKELDMEETKNKVILIICLECGQEQKMFTKKYAVEVLMKDK